MTKNVIAGTEYQLLLRCNLSLTLTVEGYLLKISLNWIWRYHCSQCSQCSQHQYLSSSSNLCISLLTVIIHKKYLGLPAIRWDKLCKHRELELDRLQLPDSFEHQHQKQKFPCQVQQVLRLISPPHALHLTMCCCCCCYPSTLVSCTTYVKYVCEHLMKTSLCIIIRVFTFWTVN